jgi:hypothetical protein
MSSKKGKKEVITPIIVGYLTALISVRYNDEQKREALWEKRYQQATNGKPN